MSLEKRKISFFDIESNGLLDQLDTIHSLVIIDDEGMHSHHGSSIADSLSRLSASDVIVGHNIICFDLPALKKVYGFTLPDHVKIIDTLVISRLIFTDMRLQDDTVEMPEKLKGRHSLASWGYRLGEKKGDFGEDTNWETWSPEMQKYCEQDVNVTKKLYEYLLSLNYSPEALRLEHDFQKVIFKQEQNGILFDTEKAREYADKIAADIQEKRDHLQKILPPQLIKEEKLPKRDNKKKGIRKGCAYTSFKYKPFNPGSRSQIVEFFQRKYGWEPEIFTAARNAKVDDEVLRGLPFPESQGFADLFERTKIQGYLDTGKNAWLKLVKNGRIYGRVITNGAVTGRCTHQSPNLANVPSARSYMGKECRSLFHAGRGVMIGADASGLELRMLAHYLSNYDGGKYARTILDSDIHSANKAAAGLETRDQAKTFIYAYLYGAGDSKLGSIVTGTKDERENKRIGKDLRKAFLSRTLGLDDLVKDVRRACVRGHLIGLDGRELKIREDYRALNTLLQGAGAVVMKKANVLFWQNNTLPMVQQVLNVHDEFEVVTNISTDADKIGWDMVQSIVDAGKHFKLNIPLDGEYRVGKNWAEVH